MHKFTHWDSPAPPGPVPAQDPSRSADSSRPTQPTRSAPPAPPTATTQQLSLPKPFLRPPDVLPAPLRTSYAPPLTPAAPLPAVPQPHVVKKPRKPRAGCEIANNELRPHVAALDRLRTWTSPFGIEHDTDFRKQLPADVVNKTYAALFASFAPETHSNYAAGLLRFHQFCDLHEISERARMPASHTLLAAFISQHVGSVGGGTVKSWMSGIKAWHDINGVPWEGEDRWVELARRTANKQGSTFKRAQRGPVTIQHMIALRASLNLTLPFDAAVWALATAAFWGCRRLGELTVPSFEKFDPKFHAIKSATARHITPTPDTSATTIPLPWTKSTRERGTILTLTGRQDELCPEKAFTNHRRINAAIPDTAPLFAFAAGSDRWSPMTKDWFMQCCKSIWSDANLLLVSGHSFRIGGSTELLLAGVPCDIVAALGGWTSLAFLLYWRKIEHIVPMNIGKAYDKDKLTEMISIKIPYPFSTFLPTRPHSSFIWGSRIAPHRNPPVVSSRSGWYSRLAAPPLLLVFPELTHALRISPSAQSWLSPRRAAPVVARDLFRPGPSARTLILSPAPQPAQRAERKNRRFFPTPNIYCTFAYSRATTSIQRIERNSSLISMTAHSDYCASSTTLSASELRSRLVDIEEKMAELESELARLRVKRDGVLGSLDSIVYPILTLPPEITSEIFIHSVVPPDFLPDDADSESDDSSEPDSEVVAVNTSPIPLRLASMCRAWRAIALSTCALWADFNPETFHSGRPNARNLPDLLKCWLPRARSLPLDLSIDVPRESQDSILLILAQYSSQWRRIDLYTDEPISFPSNSLRSPFLSLKKITLNGEEWREDGGCTTAFLDAPQLREAELHHLSLAQISLPWIQLSHLELYSQSALQCVDILEHASNLESLSLDLGSLPGQETSPASPFTMPRLRTIKFVSVMPLYLLDRLILPALETLELWHLSWLGSEVAHLVARSGCSVRTLHLFQMTYYVTKECMRIFDSVTEFTMGLLSWSSDDSTHFFNLLAYNRSTLPALEALNIDRCYGDIDIYPLATMLSARRNGVDGVAKLSSFRLSFDPDRYDKFIQQALVKILDLRVQGLKMDIHGLRKWSTRNINSQMMEELDNIDGET
ncbi:hypothetical protein FB451DRAFT_1402456 [Mycena latifolia]|nr:hypothetical protein FB451DRAFT_1402456 [Mycena latifolia]